MSRNRLKTAILGLTKEGQTLLESACQSHYYDIVAVADSDPEVTQKVAARYKCASFDDYRQLVIQNQIDVLFVAAPMYLCDEHVRTAMKKKFHVLKLVPPGLDFEETAELVRLSRKENVRFIVACIHRFSPEFCSLRNYLESQDTEKFHLITAVCSVPSQLGEASERWLSDPQLAGGGVLLYNCYGIIDQIILNFGIPQQVYSLNTNRAPDKQQRLSLTEDIAVVTMKFSDTLAGNLLASRMLGPQEQQLRIHGKEKYLTVSEGAFTVCDNLGNVLEEFKYEPNEGESKLKMLKNFALGILEPEKSKLFADERDDLKNMAVIESAYLSARTAMPEEPSRILAMIETEPTNIWTSTSKRII